jgi:hypothetical protein
MRRKRSLNDPRKVAQKPKTLSDLMKIALIIHEDGLIWVFHDKKLPDELDWVDFDADENKIYFIGKRGIPMNLGLKMKGNQFENLLNCEFLMAAHVENDDVQSMTLVPFLTRKIKEKDEIIDRKKK